MTPLVEAEEPSTLSLSAYGKARSTILGSPLSSEELRKTDAYWRACKYLALGMIYLQDNPLLKESLKPEHIKNRLLGHWGSSPGLAFMYIHLNRLIKKFDQDMIFMAGPGHGAPGVLGPSYLEGTYSEIYPDKSEDERGLLEFFKQFRFLAASAVTARRRLPARSTKVANWDTCFLTLAALRSTTLT
jgi:xylulose-5-phosphate/fructose-6-phosphate phosphoketolase